TYKMHMRNICKGIVYSLFLLISTVSWGQRNTTVLGRVIDDKGNGIHNATIVVKGTRIGASTNENGEFTISVPSTASTLIFSSVGFSTVQIPLDGRSTIEVRLEGSGKYLQSVVVTALGIKREEKALGYSVQKVSGESFQKVSGVDVATSLTGKVAGLLVKNSPNFGVAPELTIRGESPLLVVDGIAYANKTLSDISSEDIESISVLKGA